MKTLLRTLSVLMISMLVWSQPVTADDKKIGILVYDGVLTSDVTAPLEVFGVASRKTWFSDYTPVVISVNDQGTITTEEGLTLQTDTWIGNAPEVDVLIVPSAYDMDPLLENPQLISYIRQTAGSAEWMASNCSGAFLLAEAGILDGKKATTWAGGESGLQDAYPGVQVQFDTNVVIDDSVITSNGSLVSYQAALLLLSKLASESKAEEVADTIQYSRFSDKVYF